MVDIQNCQFRYWLVVVTDTGHESGYDDQSLIVDPHEPCFAHVANPLPGGLGPSDMKLFVSFGDHETDHWQGKSDVAMSISNNIKSVFHYIQRLYYHYMPVAQWVMVNDAGTLNDQLMLQPETVWQQPLVVCSIATSPDVLTVTAWWYCKKWTQKVLVDTGQSLITWRYRQCLWTYPGTIHHRHQPFLNTINQPLFANYHPTSIPSVAEAKWRTSRGAWVLWSTVVRQGSGSPKGHSAKAMDPDRCLGTLDAMSFTNVKGSRITTLDGGVWVPVFATLHHLASSKNPRFQETKIMMNSKKQKAMPLDTATRRHWEMSHQLWNRSQAFWRSYK